MYLARTNVMPIELLNLGVNTTCAIMLFWIIQKLIK